MQVGQLVRHKDSNYIGEIKSITHQGVWIDPFNNEICRCCDPKTFSVATEYSFYRKGDCIRNITSGELGRIQDSGICRVDYISKTVNEKPHEICLVSKQIPLDRHVGYPLYRVDSNQYLGIFHRNYGDYAEYFQNDKFYRFKRIYTSVKTQFDIQDMFYFRGELFIVTSTNEGLVCLSLETKKILNFLPEIPEVTMYTYKKYDLFYRGEMLCMVTNVRGQNITAIDLENKEYKHIRPTSLVLPTKMDNSLDTSKEYLYKGQKCQVIKQLNSYYVAIIFQDKLIMAKITSLRVIPKPGYLYIADGFLSVCLDSNTFQPLDSKDLIIEPKSITLYKMNVDVKHLDLIYRIRRTHESLDSTKQDKPHNPNNDNSKMCD